MKPASVAGFDRIPNTFRAWRAFVAMALLLCLAPWSWAAAQQPAPSITPVSLDDTSTTQRIVAAEVAPGLFLPNTQDAAHWQPVALDHAWRQQGWCQAPRTTYRFAFDWRDNAEQKGLGLLMYRAGNRLSVWLNGHRVSQFGDLDNADADYTNQPLLTELPWHWLKPGRNTVFIQVAGDCRRLSGLSEMELGPLAAIADHHQRMVAWLTYPNITTIVVCALMVVASVLYNMLSPNPTAARFAWINGMWAVSTWLWGMQEPALPYSLWYFAIESTYAMWAYLGMRLTMRLSDMYRPWIGKLQDVTLAFYLLATLLVAFGYVIPIKVVALYWALLVYSFLVARMVYIALREPNETRIIICMTNIPVNLIGSLDYWNYWMSPQADAYHSHYVSPVIGLLGVCSLGVVMMRQFQQAMRNDKHYQHTLEQEVQRQRQELALHYQHEQEQVQKAAVQAERQRIVRDMHDGLGAQLVGMLAAVRNEAVSPQHLESEIAQAMDHLRATMDNLSSTEQDLSTVLAQFRFLHEPRLQRAGLRLRWRVQTLPPRPWSPTAIWEVQQMLREVFANILKHARAQEITVTAGCKDGVCSIHISDDGQGFDPASQSAGRGLRHLQERAQHLGLQLSVRSAPGQGSSVVWEWAENHVPGQAAQ